MGENKIMHKGVQAVRAKIALPYDESYERMKAKWLSGASAADMVKPPWESKPYRRI